MKKVRIPCVRLFVLFGPLVAAVGLVGQDEESEAGRIWVEEAHDDHAIQWSAPAAEFHSRAEVEITDIALPGNIPAPDGKLTVFAVPNDGSEGGATLYLVNRTGEPVSLASQDGDLYFKLEFRDGEGRWIRAQNHLDSGCGNSYFSKKLSPGQHFVFAGYLPAAGEVAKVRYRCAKNPALVSNEIEGRFLEEDRIAATSDALVAADIPTSIREYFFAQGFYHGRFLQNENLQTRGIVEALGLISLRGGNVYYRRLAERLLRVLPEEAAEREDLRAILDSPWPERMEPEPFFMKCLKGASRPQPENPTDQPGRAAFAWWAIGDALAASGGSQGRERISAEAIAAAYQQLDFVQASNDGRAIAAAARLLTFDEWTREHIHTRTLLEWTQTTNTTFFAAVCGALAKRGEWETLVELGHAGSVDRRLLLLRHLATDPGDGGQRLRFPGSDREMALWLECATEEPVRTVEVLHSAASRYGGAGSYFWKFLHPPLREFLAKEVSDAPFWSAPDLRNTLSLSRVVSFLAAGKSKEDVTLFRSLLAHPAYDEVTTSSGGGGMVRMRSYPVRKAARDALVRMQELVPADLVLEEAVPE